ncbi:MAG TPA: succinyldiaminopimelate transaminase [Burkholderiaceae bacterium]|nr:succinyldiaminopimelate transaminase [Burkholderiaceae bacterium]
MNPDLARLQPYPFERLRKLLEGVAPPSELAPINLSIGEPRHPTPRFITEALIAALPALANYPLTAGEPALREAIAAWLARRHGLARIDPGTEVLPVAGSREALFAFAQAVIDRSRPARVVCPNPFYQIYEGAALLAGAHPVFLPTTEANGYAMDFGRLSSALLDQVQLVYVCSPGNPTGRVMRLEEWQRLFELADRHGFAIAADECYSEIYFDEAAPPLGALAAAQALGRSGYERLVVFGSLSKRSNVPGLRSGFVAGDAALIKPFLLYRTYHGAALGGAVQRASIAAWNDEAHVVENRRLYAAKFRVAQPLIAQGLHAPLPEAAFYLWARTPIDDAEYARRLYAEQAVTVLPGSFLSRAADGHNPGAGYVRIALVATPDETAEAAARIARFQP